MNFIERLPLSKGKNTIFMVIDKLTKYDHFLPLSHPFTNLIVAQQYLDNVYKFHKVPKSIILDRDKIFVSSFLQALLKHFGTKLHLSTTYHP